MTDKPTAEETAIWQRRLAAHVAAVEGDSMQHREHHAEAQRLIAALSDPEDRAILNRTLRVVPRPA